MPTTSISVEPAPRVLFLLRRADDALVLGHRLSEWTGRAPTLEEELALPNIALDLIGQARGLLAMAGAATGHTEDQLAYLRDDRQYRNLLLVEQPNGDFGQTIARQLLYMAYADPWWRAAARSADPGLAALAAKAEKESAYHLRHAGEWLVRLGDGTAESRARAQAGLDALWPFCGEMFEADAAERGLIVFGVAPDPEPLRECWSATIDAILARATLVRPRDGWMQSGGRTGRHGEHLSRLLAEMQVLPRTYPGAAW